MAAVNGSKRPKNTRQAVRRLLHYMGYHKFLLALVAVLVCVSSGANILGTYLLNPVYRPAGYTGAGTDDRADGADVSGWRGRDMGL